MITTAVVAAAAAAVCGIYATNALVANTAIALSKVNLLKLVSQATDGAPERRRDRIRMVMLAQVVVFAVTVLVGAPAVGVLLAGGVPVAMVGATRVRASRRRRRAERALPVVARSIADAVAAGASVRGGLVAASAAREAGVRLLLGTAATELAAGAGTSEVLGRLRVQWKLAPLDTLTTALELHARTGGDLVAVLRGIAESLEEAERVSADARSATTQAKATALIVSAMPLGVLVVCELVSPGMLDSLIGSPISLVLLVLALLLELSGFAVLVRVSRLRT